MPIAEKPQMERIIYQWISKKTQRKIYFEYLIKWKRHLIEDTNWVGEVDIQMHGKLMQELMDRIP